MGSASVRCCEHLCLISADFVLNVAHYRDILVAVKEFKAEKFGRDNMKKEVQHEAKMISHLEDHRGVPLLFSIVTKSEPLRLITKFHGRKDKCLTLSNLIKKKKLDKPTWLGILKDTIEALDHKHSGDILHNDLKSNVVMEQREQEWNPVIIDFGKARFFFLIPSQRCRCPNTNKKNTGSNILTLPLKS